MRPVYDARSWTPAEIDHAILTSQGFEFEQFSNC
jgi:hypothetical protein